jgi:hypothetical protein
LLRLSNNLLKIEISMLFVCFGKISLDRCEERLRNQIIQRAFYPTYLMRSIRAIHNLPPITCTTDQAHEYIFSQSTQTLIEKFSRMEVTCSTTNYQSHPIIHIQSKWQKKAFYFYFAINSQIEEIFNNNHIKISNNS